ncbi:uncharacterized protein RAG0_10611 [Rhynchosporium agropyri]|uniref:Uncharacterized protein n=1 Tax=Rhynchosporium agropyri TaxID=914238 RepID=A0A1E1L0K2_9HELO|nr:uncharacterized protein RAG0_10611 [Rhynchosporium agropyri]
MILPYALSAALLVTEAHAGCYGGDLWFNGLHGGDMEKTDLGAEVRADINSRCMEAKTVTAAEGCFDACLDKCEAGAGDSGITVGLCASINCRKDCDKGPPVNEFNKIDWAIEVRSGDAAKQISYGTCNYWFNWKAGRCQQGSESSHDGFWFRINPGYGKCS